MLCLGLRTLDQINGYCSSIGRVQMHAGPLAANLLIIPTAGKNWAFCRLCGISGLPFPWSKREIRGRQVYALPDKSPAFPICGSGGRNCRCGVVVHLLKCTAAFRSCTPPILAPFVCNNWSNVHSSHTIRHHARRRPPHRMGHGTHPNTSSNKPKHPSMLHPNTQPLPGRPSVPSASPRRSHGAPVTLPQVTSATALAMRSGSSGGAITVG